MSKASYGVRNLLRGFAVRWFNVDAAIGSRKQAKLMPNPHAVRYAGSEAGEFSLGSCLRAPRRSKRMIRARKDAVPDPGRRSHGKKSSLGRPVLSDMVSAVGGA